MGKWQSKESLVQLLSQLVQYQSITGEADEIAIIEYIEHLLKDFTYFQQHSNHLHIEPLDDGRQLLTALVKKSEKPDTLILLSHIDVVAVEDYGSFKHLAFRPQDLTTTLKKFPEQLPDDAREDLFTSDWLFGRGTMDMKAGTTLHLSMLERLINGEWEGNILLLVVPDEEANSLGMLKAVSVLKQIKEQESLSYKLCLNSEPMFRQYPNDENMYLYTGSLGKVLPGFLCYGKETHVGEPFHGVNANLLISYLNKNLELNDTFIEKRGSEVTPPPVSLMNRDLKEHYSVQTPVTAVSMYNVLFMKQNIGEITDKLYQVMKETKEEVEQHLNQQVMKYRSLIGKEHADPIHQVKIMDYQQLYKEAVKRHGENEVLRRQNLLLHERKSGDRDFTTTLVQDLAYLCKDIAPMIILFYSPPYYPAVTSCEHPVVSRITEAIQTYMETEYGLNSTSLAYFNGISDLSFVGEANKEDQQNQLKNNMPLELASGEKYLQQAQLSVPTINIGPLGKDAHQWTERLEINYSFQTLPNIIAKTISLLFSD
ncbi:M20/M25/M40 family metallo-hydrolase [Alkalibacillus aidingensis]|uniref:M20/M25/M40 family metallo-hydrolase n=1 Tax=Alkalibacillus aidingensis TaxID=2747607 RepID=UPI0016604813|nr:M20/M25/M40 family metallo-hydrolase [Alkalibacillus aidingensis]